MDRALHRIGRTASYEKFSPRVDNREVTIGIVGLGYVRLPLVSAFDELGFNTIGFDVGVANVNCMLIGLSDIRQVADEKIEKLVASDRITASTNFGNLKAADPK